MSLRTRILSVLVFLVLFLVLPLVSVSGQASESATEVNDVNTPAATFRVDGHKMKGYIEWMSQDKMKGRKTFTPEYHQEAKWAAANFKKWGLKPAGEEGTYFQEVPIKRKLTHRTGRPDLKIGNQQYLLAEEDFSVHTSSTAATSLKAEVVFVGYGISASDKGLDEYADVNVADKVVLILMGSPNDVSMKQENENSNQETPEDPWKEYTSHETKIKTAYDKGAGAVLLHDIRPPESQAYKQDRKDADKGNDLSFDRNFLVFTISDRVFCAIMKTDPQESKPGFYRRLKTVRTDIGKKKALSKHTEIDIRMKGFDQIEEYSAEKGNNVARNVLAKIKGTDPELKYQYIIMGGHLDHLGMRNGYVYNGADDNASGTAAVLEIARVLSEADFKPKRTIIFCCWTGEEIGLFGSNYYVSRPCDSVAVDRIVAYFNLDMVGLGNRIQAPGALNFPTIWDVIKRDQDKDVMSVIDPRTGGPGGSDHSAFISKGIEAMALMTTPWGDHPDYHKPEDDTAKIDPEILRKTGQFVLQGVLNLAQETKVDLLIEGRQALYEGMRLHIDNINPQLEESAWSLVDIDSTSPDPLKWRIASVEEKPKRTLEKGFKDLHLFEGDVALLIAASEALGFGRVDIHGSDGEWIVNGRLTSMGRYALGMMEENKIVVNLVSPSPPLLRAILRHATRPFMVTGFYTLPDHVYDQINKKKVLLGVKFDPHHVEACVKQLGRLKGALGDSDNLFLYLTSTEGLDEAKQELYISLIKKGWQAEEIGSSRRRRWGKPHPGIAGGNLSTLR
ncbi:M20/M25/M40 family metallo-hydrolase [Planctomycetota bacterium]